VKPLRKHLKLIALILSVTVLLQSCSVYTYKPTTVVDAVNSGFAYTIKVKSINNESYTFAKLEKENEQIYGIVKKKSRTASILSNQITEIGVYNYDNVKILLKEEQFKEIYIKKRDKTLSTVIPIVIGVAVTIGILGLIVDDASHNLDWGNINKPN